MSSKTRKQKKASSKLSTPDQSLASPRTPPRDLEPNEDSILYSLEEASSRYPYLVGKSAFIGRLTDVESGSKGCTIWLSDTSMVASSLSHGSVVSISLATYGNRRLNNFPLSSVTDEYSKCFEIDHENEDSTQVGNFFALAKVFPSGKVLKNGVRFSSDLFYALGCPDLGRVVFVYPVQSQFLSNLANDSGKACKTEVCHLPMHDCKKLYLELVPPSKVKLNGDLLSTLKSPIKSNDRFENGAISTPMTPQYHLKKLSTPNGTSPMCEESNSRFPKSNSSSLDSYNIIEKTLRDDSAKKLLETCATSWFQSRSLPYGNFVSMPILHELCIFRVKGADSISQDTEYKSNSLHTNVNDSFVITQETKVYLNLPSHSASETPLQKSLSGVKLDLGDIKDNREHEIIKMGGLSKEYAILKNIIASPSMKIAWSSYGIQTTKGVLLHGPPGTGKTSLARSCAYDAGINFFTVNGPEMVSQYYGESEQALREVFNSASEAAPSVVFIDELDAIAPARKEGGEELSQRMVATLLNLMDGITRTDGVLVVAATNRPDSIEPALRRPGRLDREIEIGVPSQEQRVEILHVLLDEMEHSLSDTQVQHLARTTHGFVGVDLSALCNEAAMGCLRRYANHKGSFIGLQSRTPTDNSIMEDSDLSRNVGENSREYSDSASSRVIDLPVPSETVRLSNSNSAVSQTTDYIQESVSSGSDRMLLGEEECILSVTFEDFENAKMKVRPSAMREVILEVPKVNWEDVGGQREVKNQLMEAVEWPQKHRDAFKRIGIRPPTGILMFGPPGCSKTLMARAVASEAGLNFLAVKGPELFSKWVGESEKAVRSIFAKARANAPSIIFFDEIDGLAVSRGKESDGVSVSDRVMSQLLVELDGLHQRVDVTVIAATNRPDKIDVALLRPGRFDRLLYVGPPNETDREEIFRIHLRKSPCSSNINIKELALLTQGYTGADISLICREAAILAIEEKLEDAEEITMQHLEAAIREVQSSDIHSHRELYAKFQRLVEYSTKEDKIELVKEPK